MKPRRAKLARNLQTGETIHLPAGKKISFKPSRSFKRLLNQPVPMVVLREPAESSLGK
jgi:nucleoid DNA-binding protein